MKGYSKKVTGSHDGLLAFVNEVSNYCIKAGILENNNPIGQSGVKVAEYATANEFGTQNIPARPFIGTASDEQGNRWVDSVKETYIGVILGKTSISNMVKKVGAKMKFSIKDQIKFISIPPNSPSTVKIKGFNDPLIDTGLMLETVDYEVVKKGV